MRESARSTARWLTLMGLIASVLFGPTAKSAAAHPATARAVVASATQVAAPVLPVVHATAVRLTLAKASASAGDRQVDTWRANYACRGYTFERSYPLRVPKVEGKIAGTYGYLRVYVNKHHDACAVNLASARQMTSKHHRAIYVYRTKGNPTARDYGNYRYYAGPVKQFARRTQTVKILAASAVKRGGNTYSASAFVTLRV